jgi:NodT family efflux transporter outer membrane factor (OMF) lipoprotein
MPRWNRRAAPALAAAALLAGCTTVGPNFERPAAPTAPGYAMAGDRQSAVASLTPDRRTAGAWWKALGDPALDEVMTLALANNQTVAEADANLGRARAQVSSAQGGLKPQADLTANAERERINVQAFGFAGFPNPTINLYSIGGAVSYDLDLFGGGRRRVESATARAEAEARRADAAYLTLTGNVALQALRIATLRSQIAAAEAIIADDQQNIDIVRKAEAAGGEAPSASTGGKTQLAQDQALLPPLNQQLAEARHALAALVGKAPAEWAAPDFDLAAFARPAEIPVSLPSALVRRRPDIVAAEADLHQATADIGVATARLYPDIKLSANLMQSAITPGALFSFDSTGGAIAAGLTAPIFDGGTRRADRRAAQAAAQASLARYRQTVLTAFVQVSDVMSALANDQDRIAALGQAEATAQANLRDVRAAYSLGGIALLPVVDAQRQLNQARRNRIEAEGQRMADIVKLYTATAADWREAAGS